MMEWHEKALLFFAPTFWPWPLALLACLLVIVFTTASYWFLNTGGLWSHKEGLLRSKSILLNYALAFVLPIMTGIGILLTLIPIQVPTAIYLKSASHPHSFEPSSISKWDSEIEAWKIQAREAGLFSLDIQPFVDRALQYLNNNHVNRSWDRENIQNTKIFIEAIEQSFSSEIAVNSKLKPWVQHFPRWVIESIEISVLKAITIKKNVRAYTVEAHPRITPSGHAWTGIDAYLSVISPVNYPASKIHADASERQIGDAPMIIGRPFVRVDSSVSTSIKVKPILQVRWPSSKDRLKIEIHVNGRKVGKNYYDISPDNVIPPSEKIHVLEQIILGEMPKVVELKAKLKNYESSHIAFLIGEKDKLTVSLKGFGNNFKNTIELFSQCSNPKIKSFFTYFQNSLDVSSFEFTNEADSDVVIISTDNHGMWFFPDPATISNEIREIFMDSSQKKMRVVPREKYENGIYLKASRSKLGNPGVHSLFKTPLLFDEKQHFFVDVETDTLSYIAGHKLPHWDYSSILRHTVRPLLSKWTVSNEDGIPQTIYHLALNPDQQGLYLEKDLNNLCSPLVSETYDSGRFFPVWYEILKTLKNTSVQPLSPAPVESQSRLSEPVFALDMQTQTRLRAEKILPGIVITLIGIFLHLLIVIWGVVSVRKLKSDK